MHRKLKTMHGKSKTEEGSSKYASETKNKTQVTGNNA